MAPCALAGDTARAAAVYERLLPHAERLHVRGVAGGCDGSVHHHLGVLAGTLGRRDDAERHFRRALERNARLGSPPLLRADTQAAYGALLLAGDPARASALLDAALATARTLGMAPLERRVAALRAPAPTAAGAAVLRHEGELWTIEHGGSVVRLRDSRGLRHLARLLGEPGREVAAVELARAPQAAADAVSEDDLSRAARSPTTTPARSSTHRPRRPTARGSATCGRSSSRPSAGTTPSAPRRPATSSTPAATRSPPPSGRAGATGTPQRAGSARG